MDRMRWNVGFMRSGMGGAYSQMSILVHSRAGIGNNVNYGNRERAKEDLRNDNEGAKPRQASAFSRPETRARNTERATVDRHAQPDRAARVLRIPRR